MNELSLPLQSCVVLFDIDGTLLTGPAVKPSAGVGAMNEAARVVTGLEDLYRLVEFAGRTDRQIARDLLLAAGKQDPDPQTVADLLRNYVERLQLGVLQRPYVLLPGVREAVLALRARQCVVGLGTGNVRLGAEAKLRSAGIHELFDFALGGYGDDADSRADVLRAGVRRCDPAGVLPVVIIGDTPHDIRAAHDLGAACIAVSTGTYTAESLRQAGAELVLPNLNELVPTSE